MSIVTKDVQKCRRYIKGTRGLSAMKRDAHRRDRRAARQAIQAGREPVSVPRITGRDVA